MKILQEVDACGIQIRTNRRLKRRLYTSKVILCFILCKGPNYMWHMDGYDKLSPYGITVHGCIDGYINIIKLYCIIYSFSRMAGSFTNESQSKGGCTILSGNSRKSSRYLY